MYELFIIPSAKKDLDEFPQKIVAQISKKILDLKQNPRPYGSIKLTDQQGYRIRSGNYRILYRIDDQKKIIYIYRIKHRREAYT